MRINNDGSLGDLINSVREILIKEKSYNFVTRFDDYVDDEKDEIKNTLDRILEVPAISDKEYEKLMDISQKTELSYSVLLGLQGWDGKERRKHQILNRPPI